MDYLNSRSLRFGSVERWGDGLVYINSYEQTLFRRGRKVPQPLDHRIEQEQTLDLITSNTFLNSRRTGGEGSVATQVTKFKKNAPRVSFNDLLEVVDSSGIKDRLNAHTQGKQDLTSAPSRQVLTHEELGSQKKGSPKHLGSLSRRWAKNFIVKHQESAIFKEPGAVRKIFHINMAPWIKKPTNEYDEETYDTQTGSQSPAKEAMLDGLLKLEPLQIAAHQPSRIIESARCTPKSKFTPVVEFSSTGSTTSFRLKKEGVRRSNSTSSSVTRSTQQIARNRLLQEGPRALVTQQRPVVQGQTYRPSYHPRPHGVQPSSKPSVTSGFFIPLSPQLPKSKPSEIVLAKLQKGRPGLAVGSGSPSQSGRRLLAPPKSKLITASK